MRIFSFSHTLTSAFLEIRIPPSWPHGIKMTTKGYMEPAFFCSGGEGLWLWWGWSLIAALSLGSQKLRLKDAGGNETLSARCVSISQSRGWRWTRNFLEQKWILQNIFWFAVIEWSFFSFLLYCFLFLLPFIQSIKWLYLSICDDLGEQLEAFSFVFSTISIWIAPLSFALLGSSSVTTWCNFCSDLWSFSFQAKRMNII